jgi:hypothetical protein
MDAEWLKDRSEGRVPTFRCESETAVISGNTFLLRDEIKGLGGKWNAGQKVWAIPALGPDFCDRKNFVFTQRRQQALDALEARPGVTVVYVNAQ